MPGSRSKRGATAAIALGYFCAGYFFAMGSIWAADPSTGPRATVSSPTAKSKPLPGWISAPRPLAGIDRWQLTHKSPSGRIIALAWNRDGTEIAYGDQGDLRICDAQSLKTKKILVGHAKPVTAVDWNHATNRLASSSCDGTVRVWSGEGVPEKILKGHTGEVNSVAWTKDGTRLASASSDGSVRIWNADGSAGPVIKASDAAIGCVAWSPDGKRLASGDTDHLVKIWNADGSAGPVCVGHLSRVTAVAWSSDGQRLASMIYGYKEPNSETFYADLRIWKADGAADVTVPGANSEGAMCWSPDAQQIAIYDTDHEIRICDRQGAVVNRVRIPALNTVGELPDGMAWSPNGREIAVGAFGVLAVVKIDDGSVRMSPSGFMGRLSRRPGPLAISTPNGDKWCLRFSNSAPYQVWSADGKPGAQLPVPGGTSVSLADWSPAGNQIAFVEGSHRLKVWPVGSSSTRLVFESKEPIAILAWSLGGDALAVLDQQGNLRSVRLDGRMIVERKVNAPDANGSPESGQSDPVSAVLFRADGKSLAVVERNAVEVIPLDQSSAQKIPYEGAIPGGQGSQFWWSNDGLRMTSMRKQDKSDMQLATWRLGTGKPTIITKFPDEVSAIDCSPDGRQIIMGFDTGFWQMLRADDLQAAPLESEPLVHVSSVRAAAFSHDGRQFATGGWDALVKIWSSDGAHQQTLFGNTRPIHILKWSPDGKRLTSVQRDQATRLWSLETGRPELIFEPFRDGRTILVTADGRIFGATPTELDDEFVALLEKPSGEIEIVSYTEFLKRSGQAAR